MAYTAGCVTRNQALLSPEQRLDTSYFPDLETPRQIGTRAMCCAASTAAEMLEAGGGTALLVTHSTVIESLLASHFNKRFDSVHTTNLAHLVVIASPAASGLESLQDPSGWHWTIEQISGIECEEIVTATNDVTRDNSQLGATQAL